MTRTALRTLLLATLPLLSIASPARAADAPAPKSEPAAARPASRPAKDQATLEKEFADLLTNSVLAGSFTAGANGPPRRDRYTILKAAKAEGDTWVITARIEYKGFAVPMDVRVPVKWAGDTPVISVTDQAFPGFGTFTSRVMFFDGQYAGTWSGGSHGGLMWGRVEKAAAATRPANEQAPPAGR